MKVILLNDIKKVGRKGEVVTVADGYGQNVLLKKGLALPGTAENLARARKAAGRAADKRAYDQTLLEKLIMELGGKTLSIDARANESGTLFRAVHPKQIAEAIRKEFKFDIPESSIRMEDIKQAGEHAVVLSAGKQNTTLTVRVGN